MPHLGRQLLRTSKDIVGAGRAGVVRLSAEGEHLQCPLRSSFCWVTWLEEAYPLRATKWQPSGVAGLLVVSRVG